MLFVRRYVYMLKIAYCDDIAEDRDNILIALTQIEEKWTDKFEITSFSGGEELCQEIKNTHFDIILLDILMNGIDGIETATRIRAIGEESLIIFISSYDKRIKELFDFRTIAFLDKPIDVSMLETAISKAYSIIKKDIDHVFTYNSQGSVQHISIKDIIYIESRRNEVTIHTTKGSESYYNTLTSVWSTLQRFDRFIMPHRSFIFNLNYVSIKADKVYIRQTGESFNVGSKYKEDTHNRYMAFLEKRCR